jgi:hypothetical protein
MAARVSCRLGHRHRVDLDDPRRTEPSFLAGEHMPESWRELHRATVLLKCDGPAQQGSGVSPPEIRSCPSQIWAGLYAQRGVVLGFLKIDHSSWVWMAGPRLEGESHVQCV